VVNNATKTVYMQMMADVSPPKSLLIHDHCRSPLINQEFAKGTGVYWSQKHLNTVIMMQPEQ
jgi:hypothetical protein